MTLEVSIRHRFGGFALDADFAAPPGVTALFGRSGSGKTTLVNAVAGLLRPQSGRVAVGGATLLDTKAGLCLPPHRRRIGYVFQEGRLFPHLSVRANLTYGRWFAPRGAQAAHFDDVVAMLGVGGLLQRRPGDLSGGEKQRVAIGRALLCAPRLLLMDEPLAALDSARKAEILPYLERLRDEIRIPILYVSHSVAEVARLATTVVLLDGGRVLRVGPARDMVSDPGAATAFGLRELGAVIETVIEAQEEDGLTRLRASFGPLWLPRVEGAAGARVSVRIHAHDVVISRARPEGLSALNVIPAVVESARMGDGPGALLRLRAGDDMLAARVTRRSKAALGLEAGVACFAIVKSVAVARTDIGGGRSGDFGRG